MRQPPVIEALEPRVLYSADAGLALGLLTAPDAGHELVVIDSHVPEVELLLRDLAQQGRNAVLLDAGRDALEQISEALAGREDVAALHIIAHGTDVVTLEALERKAHEIAAWKHALSADADILLYGCDVAGDAQGRLLADTLARLTGADVAASDDATGDASLGGDWDLEYSTGVIDVPVAPSASAQDAWHHLLADTTRMISGAFTGNGIDDRVITGLGFAPDVVIVFSDASEIAVIRTSTMAGDLSKPMAGGTAPGANLIQSLGADGFTLGNDARVNANGTSYYWAAFEAGDDMTLGTYVGSGSAQSIAGTGFSPEVVFVLPAGSTKAVWHSIADTSSHDFDGGAVSSTQVTSLNANGFSLGTSADVNSNGAAYHYIAFNEAQGVMDVGTYTGDGADNRNVTGLGFAPEYLMVERLTGTSNDDTRQKTESSGAGTDEAFQFDGSVPGANEIQALQADGFQLGTDGSVNANGRVYAYFAWRQMTNEPRVTFGEGDKVFTEDDAPVLIDAAVTVADPDSADFDGGTLTVSLTAGGTADDRLAIQHVGTSAGQIGISGANVTYGGIVIGTFAGGTDGSTPLVVTFNANATQTATEALLHHVTFENISNTPVEGVRSLQVTLTDGDGYASPTVTKAIAVDALMPAATLMISGSYTGDGLDNRAIAGLGFEPDVIIVTPDSGGGGAARTPVIRTSTMAGDVSKDMTGGTALTANLVQSLDVDGFTLGTDAQVNANGITYHWVAFKAGDDMVLGTYTGTGSNQSLTDLGFSPELVFVLGESADKAVFRSSVSNATWDFAGGASSSVQITSLDADGFSLGTNGVVNNNADLYHYIAWNEVAGLFDVGTYTGDAADDRNITGTGLEPEYAIVKRLNAGRDTIHKTESSGAATDKAYYFDGTNGTANLIQALQADGFQVGAANQINQNGDSYAWFAWRQQTAPAGADKAVTTAEDTPYTFTAADFAFSDPDPGESLSAVLIDTLPSAGSLRLSGVAVSAGDLVSAGDIAAGNLTFVPAADGSGAAYASFAFKVGDEGLGFDATANTMTVDITAVNDAPVLNAVQLTVSEGGTRVFAPADFSVTDPDNAAFTYTVSGVAGGGFEVFSGAAWNAATSFTTAQLAAGEVRFVDDGDEVAPSFSVTASDGTANSNTLAAMVTYTPANDAPVLNAAALSVSQGQTATLSGASFGITDPDDASFTYAASGVTGGYFQLSSNAGVAITSFTSADLAGGLVQFVDDGDATAPAFSVTVNDGDVDSNTLAASLTFTPAAPNAPVADLNAGGAGQDVTVAFTEQTPVLIAPAGTLTDTDSANLASLTVTLIARPDGDAVESLSLDAAASAAASGAGLTVGYTASSGVLSITGSASVATYQTILQGIRYDNTSDAPSTGNRAVTVVANDGTLASLTQTATAMVTEVNDAPVLNSAQLTVGEGGTRVFAPADFSVTDPDNAALTYTVSGVVGGSFEVFNGATWNAAGTFTTAQLAAGEVRFVDDGNEVAPSFNVTANDGTANSNTLVATVTYIPANDAPVLSAAQLTVSEGGTRVFSPADFTLTDPDSAAFTYTVSGVAGGSFEVFNGASWNAATSFTTAELAAGEVRFVDDGNEVAPSFNVTASDGTANSNTLAATVTYTAVNDAPTATIGPVSYGVLEDDTPRGLGGVSIGDVDAGTGLVSVSVAVGNGSLTLGSTTGLTFTAGANGSASMTFTATVANANAALTTLAYQPDAGFNGTDNLSLSVDDQGNTGGGAATASDTASITVSPVNDAPSATITATAFTATEQTGLSLVAGVLSVSDIDGPSVQATLSVGEGVLDVSAGTTGATVANSGTATVTISGTQAQINALLAGASGASVLYTNGSDTPSASTTLTLSASDGTLSASDTATINITAVNDAPVLGAAQLTVGEGGITVLTPADFNVTDPDSTAFTFTASGVAGGSFEVFDGASWNAATTFTTAQLAAGEVRFVDDGNEAAPSFSVTASDGTANSNTLAATVTYTSANDAPLLNAAQLTVSEGGTTVLTPADFSVTDPDSAAFTYTVSAVAGGSFEVFNGATWSAAASFTTAQLTAGEVRFVDDGNEVAPSFNVTVNDGTANSNTLAATVTYTLANDAPVLNAAQLTVSEGGTTVLAATDFNVTDPDSAAFTYTVSGVAGGSFEVFNGASWNAAASFTTAQLAAGEVRFVDDGNEVAPSFNVTVNDGTANSNTLAATVTYTPANDVPVLNTAQLTVSEGGTTVLAAADFDVADPDDTAFTFTAAGVAGGSFQVFDGAAWNAASTFTTAQLAAGEVRFVHDGGEAAPSFGVTAGDGAASSAALGATVTYTNVNDAPLANASGAAATFTAGGAAVAVDAGLAVVDPDNATLASATVAITGGFQAAQDGLYFTGNAATMGNIAGSYDAASGVLTLSSAGASATLAQWQAALGSVSYANAAATPGSATRTVSIAVSDGAAVSATVSMVVNVASPAPSSTPPPAATPPATPPVVIATPPLATGIPGANTTVAAPQPLPQAPQARVMAPLEASLEATGELQIPGAGASSGGYVQSAAAGGSGVPGVRPGASAGAGPGTPTEADLLAAEALTQAQLRPIELFQLEPGRSGGAHPAGGELARLQESAQREEEIQSRTTIVLAAGSLSMTLAYLLWLVRGGALAASVLAALPAWRLVDPLPILPRARDAEADDGDGDEAIAAFAEAPGAAQRA